MILFVKTFEQTGQRRHHTLSTVSFVCIFNKLGITALSDPVRQVTLYHSHWSSQGEINDACYESDQTCVCVSVFFRIL